MAINGLYVIYSKTTRVARAVRVKPQRRGLNNLTERLKCLHSPLKHRKEKFSDTWGWCALTIAKLLMLPLLDILCTVANGVSVRKALSKRSFQRPMDLCEGDKREECDFLQVERAHAEIISCGSSHPKKETSRNHAHLFVEANLCTCSEHESRLLGILETYLDFVDWDCTNVNKSCGWLRCRACRR